jgi:hypothetical protein
MAARERPTIELYACGYDGIDRGSAGEGIGKTGIALAY